MPIRVLQPDAIVLGHAVASGVQVEVADGRITALHEGRESAAERVEGTLLPGFVDLQVNGAGGCSVQDAAPDGLDEVARTVRRHGAAAFLPTLITGPFGQLLEQVRGVAEWIERVQALDAFDGAFPLGIHVEGPFLITAGAHAAEDLLDPTPARIEQLLAAGRGHVRLVTLAPSRPGAAAAVAQLSAAGVCVSLGHGSGVEGIADCVAAGATMATHLFNAMGPWNHRDPGLPGTVLDQPEVSCGIILDEIHVSPVMARLAVRCLGVERTVLVTDCVSAMGMPDGDYRLADSVVTLKDGAVRNGDGTLAGSALTMFRAGENFLRLVPWTDAAWLGRVASTNPARLAGAAERFGRIAAGGSADLAVLGSDGTLRNLDGEPR